MSKVAILSRYKESNNFWYSRLLQAGYKVIIYNKHQGHNLIENIGRESHTYFKFIIDNYERLPEEMLFSQYDPIDHFSSIKRISFSDSIDIFLNKNLLDFCGIRPIDFEYIVRKKKVEWVDLSRELFGKFEKEQVDSLAACGATLNGVFRVSRDAVLKRDISFYRKALEMASRGVDPAEGYYFERMWKFIFMSIGCENNDFDKFKDRVFLFGEADKKHRKVHFSFRNKIYNHGHIKLSKDGTIRSNGNVSYYHHLNESYWVIKKGVLFLLDYCGAATSKYIINNDSEYFQGDFSDPKSSGDWIHDSATLSKPFWQ